MELNPDSVLLQGRTAVVTGAGRGIGAAIAKAMARFGARVALFDIDGKGLSRTEQVIASSGGEVIVSTLDVRDIDEVNRAIEEVEVAFGPLDILVNNAGGTFFAPFVDINERGEEALIAENFTSVTRLIRRCLLSMNQGGGSIVNVTSIEAHRAAPGFSVYAAMKAGVASLTMTLALELATRGVRINCIAPDMIPTTGSDAIGEVSGAVSEEAWRPTPWPHVGSVDDIAAAAVFLAGDLAKFVTGSTLHVDGGTWAAGGWKMLAADGRFVV